VVGESEDDGESISDKSNQAADVKQPKTVKTPPINQKMSNQGGERPNDSKPVQSKSVESPAVAQSAPQTNDPASVEPSIVPKAVIPADTQPVQLPLTPVESTVSAPAEPDKIADIPEKLKSSEKPSKSQFDTYVGKATSLRLILEKNGLKAGKGITVGAKLKNYVLSFSGAKELTDLAIYQWEDFFLHAEATDPIQLVNLIEGVK